MKKLLDSIEELKKGDIKYLIDTRIYEFEQIQRESIDNIFKELCFCIMTANCGAEKCMEIHEGISDGFLHLTQEHLTEKFKDLGYRFPNVRSIYIVEAREYKDKLHQMLNSTIEKEELRDWVVKHIKGLGYKEASHFLRNIGYKNYAIIDFHIVDVLAKYHVIEKPKTMTKKKYLEIEEILEQMANRLNLNMAELDLYLWYLETGKILK
ncbi:MAG: N-glycosylase/DNA lyase [Promethearchaeota archaeon]|nr:MAG: N-glycosylase/DNA lyase [Candidatus Lokiarchaeota archaeon]